MRKLFLRFKSLIAPCALAGLAACSNDKVSQPDAAAQEVDAIIAAAVAKTAAANAAVSEIEKQANGFVSEAARTPDSETEEDSFRQQHVAVEWKGPIAPLLDSLARRIGYELIVSGKPPANPVQVAVTGFSGLPPDAVAAIDIAAFGFAKVAADESNKTITLAYPG